MNGRKAFVSVLISSVLLTCMQGESSSQARPDSKAPSGKAPRECACGSNKHKMRTWPVEIILDDDGSVIANPPWPYGCVHKKGSGAPPDSIRWVNRTGRPLILTFFPGWPFQGPHRSIHIAVGGTAARQLRADLEHTFKPGCDAKRKDWDYTIDDGTNRLLQQGPGVISDD